MEIPDRPGGCLRQALEDAGVDIPEDLDIPAWTTTEDNVRICDALGLRYIGDSGVFTAERDAKLIAIVRTAWGTGHAMFVRGSSMSALDGIACIIVVEGEVEFTPDGEE